jgi:hypothetical protein
MPSSEEGQAARIVEPKLEEEDRAAGDGMLGAAAESRRGCEL